MGREVAAMMQRLLLPSCFAAAVAAACCIAFYCKLDMSNWLVRKVA